MSVSGRVIYKYWGCVAENMVKYGRIISNWQCIHHRLHEKGARWNAKSHHIPLQLIERIDIATAGGSQHIFGAPNFETYPCRFRIPQAKHTKTVSTQTVRFHLHGLSLKLGEMQQVPNAHGLKVSEVSTFGSGSVKASRLALLCAKQWITKP